MRGRRGGPDQILALRRSGTRLAMALLSTAGWACGTPAARTTSDYFPTITPDGALVVFSAISYQTGDSDLWSIDARGVRRQLTFLRPGSVAAMEAGGFTAGVVRSFSLYPAVAPDGRSVAFVHVRRTPEAVTPVLHRLDLASGATATVLEIPAQRIGPVSWSPDGQRLLFTTDRSGRYELWQVPARGGAATQLTSLGTHIWSSSWAPSDTIVFAANPHSDSSIAFQPERLGGWELFSLDPASGRVEQLTDNAHDDFSPAWDPAASRVAFVSRDSGQWRIKVLDWKTRGIETVTASDCYLDHPAWRPDGQALIVTRGASREFDGYLSDLQLLEISLRDGTERVIGSPGQVRGGPARACP